MSNIIAVLNTKGGAGKTTLSIHIAQALALSGERVLLIDTDPQGSARDWNAEVDDPKFSVIGFDRDGLDKQIADLSQGYEWVIIDGAAKQERANVAPIKSADLVVIPIAPSPLDLWACSDLVDSIKARQELTDGSPVAAFQVTKVKKGTTLSREINSAVSEYGFELFNGMVGDRTNYVKSLAEGKTAFEISGKDSPEQFEINHLIKQIKVAFED